MEFKVVKEYLDAPDSPIQVVTGEELDLVEESDPKGDWANWVLCRGNNKQGWVPKQILDIDAGAVTVLEDYTAVEHSLKLGERVVKIYELNGWIWCRKLDSSEQVAWAPLNHLVST
ncbi:SH3 domain-containing protein [Vibrio europaeus]|uniref:SH3 domain-containing protein n=1 Tax=Vibrio europaeus TaxID=300876 RepID=A0AAE7B0A5_9VIBR|nr:SH3 domain-containing protein [Vibrio europaeus]MDC5812557.1 SH3 domain-containing protein [Vibrio europaeus]QJY38954.1 hypothetical protein HOO69_20630 [Vibrio europaeus]QPG33972.1 hypothetical protein IXK98_07625 [Vibrio europaeus]